MTSHFTIRIASDAPEVAACQAIRRRIFVEEQGIPAALDEDGLDDGAIHVIVLEGKLPVATGRLVMGSTDGSGATRTHGVLARIAVVPSHRGHGLGPIVVRALEEAALGRGAEEVSLEPHHHLEAFYRRLGYHTVDGVKRVGEHGLITMAKTLGVATETGGAGKSKQETS